MLNEPLPAGSIADDGQRLRFAGKQNFAFPRVSVFNLPP